MTTPEQEERTSKEDRFFGLTSTIGKKSDEDDEKIEIEFEGEAPENTENTEKQEAKDDDELEEYSERVQKRINNLTKKYREAERERDEAAQLREEAIRYAQAASNKNRELQSIITTGEATLVDQIKRGAESSVAAARNEFLKAKESVDPEAEVAAYEKLIAAQAELIEANRYGADYERRKQQHDQWVQQQQYAQQQPQQQAPKPRQPSEKARDWAEQNEWFNNPEHVDMTSFAIGTHQKLVGSEGFSPDSDEYFEELDKRMRKHFPEHFGVAEPSRAPRETSVVAPAGRSNGAKPRRIRLTESQVRLAKRLGITPEEYAEEALKLEMQRNG